MSQEQRQGATASVFSNLPEVSGLTIAVVGSGCAVLIVCLLMVLVFFCCRRRRAKQSSGSDSDQFSHRDASSVERKVMSYMQYNSRDASSDNLQSHQAKCGGLHHQHHQQHQQYATMVSPHPSLTSTDETSVDQGSSKVFATLVSGNNPAAIVTIAHNSSGSDSDHSHSGSLLRTASRQQQQQQQQQRKIIYEVVV